MMLCCMNVLEEEAILEEEATSFCVENDVCVAHHKPCAQSAQSLNQTNRAPHACDQACRHARHPRLTEKPAAAPSHSPIHSPMSQCRCPTLYPLPSTSIEILYLRRVGTPTVGRWGPSGVEMTVSTFVMMMNRQTQIVCAPPSPQHPHRNRAGCGVGRPPACAAAY